MLARSKGYARGAFQALTDIRDGNLGSLLDGHLCSEVGLAPPKQYDCIGYTRVIGHGEHRIEECATCACVGIESVKGVCLNLFLC